MAPPDERLSTAQRTALRHVDQIVASRQTRAQALLAELLRASGCARELLDSALESIRLHARVVVHFHPDRRGKSSVTVAEALLADGLYKSQFETGSSTGSRTAFPGGDRDVWERTLFGGAYHTDGVSLAERPKYGALELIRYPDGPWPRFGSCHLVLDSAIGARTSFTFSGSEQERAFDRLGTIDRLEGVMAPLLVEIAAGEGARVPWPPFTAPTLGDENATVGGFVERLSQELPRDRVNSTTARPGRVLDTGIEAQIHGPIDLGRHVERLVVDPAFRDTPTGDQLRQIGRKYSFSLEYHPGFRLAAREVPEEFRGPAVSRLARRIAGDGMIDAATIGAAEASLYSEPERWRDWGTRDETLQHLKQLWHVLVHYGAPASE